MNPPAVQQRINIVDEDFLDPKKLKSWAYQILQMDPKNVGAKYIVQRYHRLVIQNNDNSLASPIKVRIYFPK